MVAEAGHGSAAGAPGKEGYEHGKVVHVAGIHFQYAQGSRIDRPHAQSHCIAHSSGLLACESS